MSSSKLQFLLTSELQKRPQSYKRDLRVTKETSELQNRPQSYKTDLRVTKQTSELQKRPQSYKTDTYIIIFLPM